MENEILVPKNSVVIFSTILNEEYVCVAPRNLEPGLIDGSDHTVIGKLQYDTKYKLSFPSSDRLDSNGNLYQKVEPGLCILIEIQSFGVRPPILKYP